MSVRGGQVVTVDFSVLGGTGALANADSTPTGTLVVNGADNAAAVTVTSKATGLYKAAVTLPELAVGDVVQLRVAATVGGVATGDYVWGDSADIAVTAAGKVPVAQLAAADFAAGALNGKGDWSTYAGGDTAGTTTLLARLTAPRAAGLDNLDAAVSSRSTYAGADTPGTTTLLSRVTAAVALAGSAPSWYAAPVDVSANVTAVKAKTDLLAFASGAVLADVRRVNNVAVTGTGAAGAEWGPA